MTLSILAGLMVVVALSQEAPAPLALNEFEKQFQEAMTNVKLVGHYTSGESAELHDDSYVIEKISKIKEDTWRFEARILYNKRDFKVVMNLPVKFAGDTPVISLTNFAVPGFGTFTARVVFYNAVYAGTWGGAGHGGTLFGKIVKNEPAPTPQQ
jgi:hypothetical protein